MTLPQFSRPLLGARVLIAEDDPILAFDLAQLLEDAGAHIVGPAGTLPAAVALASQNAVDCAVLDVSLREEHVFPAAHILHSKGAGIVFYSGYSDVEGLKANWPRAHVLVKPASPKTLVTTVGAACLPLAPRAKP